MCQKLFHWVGEMPQFLKNILWTKKPRKSQGGLSNMLWVQIEILFNSFLFLF